MRGAGNRLSTTSGVYTDDPPVSTRKTQKIAYNGSGSMKTKDIPTMDLRHTKTSSQFKRRSNASHDFRVRASQPPYEPVLSEPWFMSRSGRTQAQKVSGDFLKPTTGRVSNKGIYYGEGTKLESPAKPRPETAGAVLTRCTNADEWGQRRSQYDQQDQLRGEPPRGLETLRPRTAGAGSGGVKGIFNRIKWYDKVRQSGRGLNHVDS